MDQEHLLGMNAPQISRKQSFESTSSQEILREPQKYAGKALQGSVITPWIISLMLFSLLMVQNQQFRFMKNNRDCFWNTYEIGPAKRDIPVAMKQVKFTGGLRIEEGVGLIREVDPTLPTYVGEPSPEIDAAWEDLIHPLNIFITKDELEGETQGTSPDPETGLYVAMPQGFHDLHCLNMIRQRLNLDYYEDMRQMNHSVLTTHIDHCLDSLRQSLMCTGDMTNIKLFWMEKRKRMMADFDNLHMCRDFDSLKSWLRPRSAEDDSKWRENADRILGSKHYSSKEKGD